jgi:dTDP-4-amino-4,6-dideoxygalactose transaminase
LNEIKVPMSRPSIDIETLNSTRILCLSGWVSQGKKTEEFEANLSEYFSSKVVVVNNGTSALTAALLAHGTTTLSPDLIP